MEIGRRVGEKEGGGEEEEYIYIYRRNFVSNRLKKKKKRKGKKKNKICKYIFISRNSRDICGDIGEGIWAWTRRDEAWNSQILRGWRKARIQELEKLYGNREERRRGGEKNGREESALASEVGKDWKRWPSSINLLDPVIIVDEWYNRYTHDPDT